jgi:hypothetical protein
LSGAAAPTGNFQQDIGSSVHAMYASLLKADPTLKSNPRAAALAVDQMIEQAKGFDSSTRVAMQSANEVMKAQIGLQEATMKAQQAAQTASEKVAEQRETAQARIQAQLQEQTEKLTALIDKAKIDAGSREKVAGTNAGARVGAAKIGATSRENVAQTGAGARTEAAKIGAGSRETVADKNVAGRQGVADTGAQARVKAARIGMNKAEGTPLPSSTKDQWKQVPAANRAAAKKHLEDQGYDTSGLK